MKQRTALICLSLATAALLLDVTGIWAQTYGPNPNVNYDLPNYANSPILRKFVDSLPGLDPGTPNGLGQYVPVAKPMALDTPTGVPRDGDYYEIAVVDYTEKVSN